MYAETILVHAHTGKQLKAVSTTAKKNTFQKY